MKRNGFTLIELMIVIAILGIVAAVVLPLLTGHRTDTDSYGQSREPAPAANPVDNTKCVGGVVVFRGTPVITNGNTIRC